MMMQRRTNAGLKLLMLLIAACTFLFSPVFALAQPSEVETLLNSSHETSWAYFRDPSRNDSSKWYISHKIGTTYGLSFNISRHLSWIAIANEGAVADLDFVNKKVSLSPSTAALTPSDKYLAISLAYGEANQYIYNNGANQWANLIAGYTLDMDWYFFKVESTGKWYIVWIDGTDSTVINRMELNSSSNNYAWQLIDTSNWKKEFFQDNSVWKVRFSAREFLSFPLSTNLYPQGAYTPQKINSVLDHSMSAVYSDHDGTILSFTGELFEKTVLYPSGRLACYPKAGNGVWSPLLSSLYKGTGSGGTAPDKCSTDVALNYEAHPGYDYVAALYTSVKAAAGGKVVNNTIYTLGQTNTLCVPKGMTSVTIKGCAAWGAVGIDHGNGYITQYLHLSSITVNPGQTVNEGQEIGLSGDTGVKERPHLHFEVLNLRSGADNFYQP